MDENSTDSIPFLVLNAIMDDDYRETVVRRALGYRGDATQHSRQRLAEALHKGVRVRGYRSAAHARTPLLLGAVVEVSYQSNELMGAILQVWVESHSQLQETARAFLSAAGTTVVEISMQDGFTGEWTAAEMLETAEVFRREHPDFDEDDVALMLCCLTGQAPIPDGMAEVAPTPFAIEELDDDTQGEESQEEVSTLKWEHWLEELQALPSDAAEWETVAPFIEGLQRLAQEKLQERKAVRDVLQEALHQLMEQAAEELEYFGLTDVAGWNAETCPLAEVTAWAEEIESFRGLLTQHREIRQGSAASLEEERRRRKTLGDLEEKVIQAHAHLATLFMPPPFPEGPEPDEDRESPELEEEPLAEESVEFVAEPPEEQVELATEPEPPQEEAVSEVVSPVVVEEAPAQDETPQPVKRTETPGVEPVEEEASHEEFGLEELPEVIPPSSEMPLESEISEDMTTEIVPQEISEMAAPEAAIPAEEEIAAAIEEPQIAAAQVEADLEPQPSSALPLSLCSSREVAIRLQTGTDDGSWQSLVWALVAEDDLPAAYWLTRSLAASGHSTPLPDGLLAAAQGARWLSSDSDLYVYDLLELVQGCRVAPEPVQEMIGLAAALRPTLVAPHSGLVGWLNIRACEPIFHELANVVREFAELDITLRPEDLLGVAGAEQRKAALIEAAQAAKRWLDEAPERRTKLKRASDVWRRFAKQDLQEILAPVSENRQAHLERVRRRLDQWQQQGFVSNQIDLVDRELIGPKGRPISGSPRQQIIRRVEEACDIASRWCSLVEHEREIETRGKWLFEQIGSLRADLQIIIPQAEGALIRLEDPAQHASMAAAASCLRRTLLQLWETLALSPQESEPEPLSINSWPSLQFGAEDLQTALGRRLFWLPELALTAEGQPVQSTLSLIPIALRDACAEERSLHDAMEGWLQKQDYRFTEWLLSALHDEADTVSLSARIQEAVAGSQVALRDSKDQTINAIEQAVVDGIITEERSEYSAAVEAVDPAETLDFASKYGALRAVRESLSAARQKRLAELRANWQVLEERLTQSPTEASKREQVRQFLQSALERGDTRVVEESLARLTETFDAGRELDVGLFARPETRDLLSEFREAESDVQGWLEDESLHQVATNIESGQTRAQIRFGRLPAKRRTEASEALFAWRRLKQQMPEASGIPEYISTLLRYLGFSLEPDTATPIEVKTSGTDWVHAQVRMSASLLARPIPQFGSQAYGCYDVICLWDRPGAATIAARLRDLQLSAQSVLVLFLGRLTLRQRGDLTRVSREQELALAVLDETMLVFLAQERDTRLPAFLRCALPFAALNPYTPFQAGDVPPEMFYGREDMARELQRPAGSCLVFGGRQLGKSALLRHVARQFHYPDREQYSWVENLKLIYLPEAGKETDNIWRALRENFKENRLLSRQVKTDRPDEIARRIRRAMNEVPDRRVLVMFDEADEFLDADAADSFRQVIGLRELMLETERRFKVIFAGLHNVQRFQGIPNQPLAHFGAPLCVGPLEPGAAQQLVREPLDVLGYRFTEAATVLRVLSYTNYHPGLIQLFCQELLNELYEQGGSSLPPHLVEQKVVETVYRKPQVRERIRERFDWTLALDMRYQAIAWTLIEDQMEVPDSYAHPYPSGDILRMVRGWWPQVFDDMSLDQLRGLLDEMCGLGVLVRNTEGYYRLRSPNLVRLMGTAADIEDRLLELSDKQPPQPPDADNHHAPLDDAAQRYSSLTYSQERSLNPPGFGVGLIFASRAGGADSLAGAFRRFVPSDLPDDTGKVMEIPKSVIDARYLRDWLDVQMQTLSRQDRRVLYHRPGIGSPEDMASLVQEALDFSRRRQSRDQWVRLLFVFEPRAAWKWLSLPPGMRTDLENRADAVTYPRPWNLVGVRQRLAQHDKMHSDEVCQEVLSATGGWHYLIEALFARSRGKDDPRPFAREIEKELQDADSQLHQDFLQSLGLEVHDAVRRVLQFIVREAEHGITADFVTPEFVGGQPALRPEDCMHATEYLQRMACVELHGETLLVDNLVRALMSEL